METMHLQWSIALLTNLDEERYSHLYLLVRGGRVIYAGNSFGQNLKSCVLNTMERLRLDPKSVEIWLGRGREVGQGIVNRESVKQARALLVYALKPILHLQGKIRYEGSASLRLENHGCPYLHQFLRAENGIVFRSMKMGIDNGYIRSFAS